MGVDTLLIQDVLGEVRIAGLDAGADAHRRLVSYDLYREDDPYPAGTILLGRVTAVVANLNAAFVDIGAGEAGFLSAADARPTLDTATGTISDYVHEGAAVLVQVLRAGEGGKGAKLSRRIALTGRHMVFRASEPGVDLSRRITDVDARARLAAVAAGFPDDHDGGWTIRTAAAAGDDETLLGEARALHARWQALAADAKTATPPQCLAGDRPADFVGGVLAGLPDRPGAVVCEGGGLAARLSAWAAVHWPALGPVITVASPGMDVFEDHGIADAIEGLLSPDVALPGGGRLRIDEVAALTVIDVDTGTARGRDAALAVNLAAAEDIPRQMRLRGIGGLVVVDFVSGPLKDHGGRIIAALRKGFGDRAVRISGPSAAGLVELVIRRAGPSLRQRLMVRGPGWVLAPATVARRALARLLAEDRARPGIVRGVAASAAVIAALEGAPARADVEHRLGRALVLRVDDGIAGDAFEVVEKEPD